MVEGGVIDHPRKTERPVAYPPTSTNEVRVSAPPTVPVLASAALRERLR
jgi:hypothetical protein